ncbi:MAG TPA: pentapeptide repeat-containing protein [Candidatus Micrarchaeia archaeon]|nr:pentapeptide repeat-containing protein [Candidatus Micrarchaeia archaeon]
MGSVLHRLFTREIASPPKSATEQIPLTDSVATSTHELPPTTFKLPSDTTANAISLVEPSLPEPAAHADSQPPDTQASPEAIEPELHSLIRGNENSAETDPGASAKPDETRLEEKPDSDHEIEASTLEAGTIQFESRSLSFMDTPRVDPEEWKLEEALAGHREWLESKGRSGKKSNFAGAQLADRELISADLRYADMQGANLRSTDLLLADLRGTCLVGSELDEACLVGANLEAANLEGASLSTAMGLLPRQLAGANLHDASLPSNIAEFHALPDFEKASQMAARYFTTLMGYCITSWLVIWKTRDAQLLTDSAVLPYVHATTALPTAEFYLISPVALLILYLVFHYHLQQTWEKLMELPAVFPDGRELGATGPRIIMGLARAHFYWLSPDSPSERFIEKWAVRLLAYWLTPFTLLLYWGRYLTVQEIHGTLLHEALVVGAAGVALYSTQRVGRRAERWVIHPVPEFRLLAKLENASLTYSLVALVLFLAFLSVGTMIGVPHDHTRAPQYGPANFRRWAPNVLWAAGLDPYADLTEASLSSKPLNWSGDDSQLSSIKGPHLNQANLRYAEAYGAFLPNAHLWRANLEGAYFSLADLRGSDLSLADLRYTVLDSARLANANLDRATLEGTIATRADFRGANLSYVSLERASLVDARFDSASLYSARLNEAVLIRANLEKADLRDAQLERANLSHADLQQAYLWSAKLSEAKLDGAKLEGAILIDADLSGADLRGATFQGTVLTDANLQGAQLDGADLRGVLRLGAAQICSAQSHRGTMMDDALQASVNSQCGPILPPAATPPVQSNSQLPPKP